MTALQLAQGEDEKKIFFFYMQAYIMILCNNNAWALHDKGSDLEAWRHNGAGGWGRALTRIRKKKKKLNKLLECV